MRFGEIIEHLLDGRVVRRRAWAPKMNLRVTEDINDCGGEPPKILNITNPDGMCMWNGVLFEYTPRFEDLVKDDWEIVADVA